MAIYRGPGGPGDATTDAANEASAAVNAATAAASSAASAANSASSASTSASAASSSASAAASSASAAASSASAAAASAVTASDASDASINLVNTLAVSATTLSAGSSATASFDSGTTTLTLGIPTGATGATGSTGATGATGATGPQGEKGLNWQGAYGSGTAYDVDDAVSYLGSSYICILASTGNAPTNATYWQLLASKGDDGAGGGGSGTVTSVDATVPTGLSVSGVPITTSGTIAISYASGYSIPTTTKQGQWDTAYGWGNHASAGYLTSSAIGTTIQGYDADTAKYDDATANFSGTLQNGGSNVLVDTDIGTAVQAYDADLTTWAGKTAPTGTVVGTSDTQTLTNKTLTAPSISDPVITGAIDEQVYNLTGTAIDPSNGTIQYKEITDSVTLTDSLAEGESVTLMIKSTTPNDTVTWPTTTWVNNGKTAPSTITGDWTVVALWKVSTTLYGALVGDGT